MSSVYVLSGWAMPQTVFSPLQKHCNIKTLALPGIEPWSGICENQKITWELLVNALDTLLPKKPVVLAGWSLGGLIAICYAALHPNKVKHLVLMGCNPCFISREGWHFAMSQALFHTFASGMNNATETTLKKFMLLCSRGSQDSRAMFRQLQQLMMKQSVNIALLVPLLLMLSDDLRPVLANVQCSVTHLLGKQDALVSVTICEWIKKQYLQHQVQTIDGGHLFFREQPETVAQILMEHSIAE